MSTEEEWRPIVGFPGYEVSNLGRARSLHAYRGRPGPRILPGTPNNERGGYLRVNLNVAGKQYHRMLHRLIGETFFGPLPDGMVTRHLNGDPTDNRVSNLTYGTQTENALDTVRHGRNRQASQTECVSGHPLEGSNLRVLPNGHRACRECSRIKGRKYVTRLREKPKSELNHGTGNAYIAGCRCDTCKAWRAAKYQADVLARHDARAAS